MDTLTDRIEKICDRIWKIIETIMNSDLENVIRYIPLLIILVIGLFILPKLQWLIDVCAYAWLCLEVTHTRRLVENDIEIRRKERRG